MLIAIAAALVASAQPTLTDDEYRAKVERNRQGVEAVVRAEAALVASRTNRCAAKVMEASAPGVRYDHGAADPGAMDKQPYRGEVQLFSAVELKVEGCSLPVIRARASDVPPLQNQAPPIDR
jgi:hypothetical protein